MICKLIDPSTTDWNRLDQFEDRTVFQTCEWMRFLSETQDATPIVAELHDAGEVVGYFTGLTFSRFGIKILGSSFPGWTTPYIGFNLLPGVSRVEALGAVEKMAWDTLKCLHMEVSDPNFTIADGKQLGVAGVSHTSYTSGLTQSEE